MNFKFNLQGVDVQINEDSSAKIEKLEIEYTDIKLNEVPAIISAFKGLFAEINQQMNPSYGATPKVYNPNACEPGDMFTDSDNIDEQASAHARPLKTSELFED